MDTNVPLASLP